MAAEDLLASWRDTPTRQAIVEYVDAVTGDGPGHVPVEERIATFDNDGTLWCEKPLPIQLAYVLRKLAEMAEADPQLQSRQPWKAAYEHDLRWLSEVVRKHYDGDDTDAKVVLGGVIAALAGTTVDEYAEQAATFVRDTHHPTLARPYEELGFVPMVELLRYLEANGFATFIATGGDRDFMRPLAQDLYGVPPERIIGSSNALSYDADARHLVYLAQPDVFDDGPVKPVRIWSRVGRRPILAVGNANGDIPMLDFAGGLHQPLRVLVNHDDAEREFDYTSGAEVALARAATDDWTTVSIKDDWDVVFR